MAKKDVKGKDPLSLIWKTPEVCLVAWLLGCLVLRSVLSSVDLAQCGLLHSLHGCYAIGD